MVGRGLILLAVLLAGPAHAGAWARGQGQVFLSTALSFPTDILNRTANEPFDPGTVAYSLYGEYGLSDRVTLGFDAYLGAGSQADEVIFLFSHALRPPDARHQMSWSLGLGQRRDNGAAPLTRFGLHWGKGHSHGWFSADGYVTSVNDTVDVKADLTAGWNVTPRIGLIAQVQTGKTADGPAYARLAPSLVWSLGSDGKTRLELGAEYGVVNVGDKRLTLGVWRSF